jgi:hypothetical protein
MNNYAVRGYGRSHFMTIVDELEDSFLVRIVKDRGGREDVTTDFISKDFFDNCIRTGYLSKMLPEQRKERLVAASA